MMKKYLIALVLILFVCLFTSCGDEKGCREYAHVAQIKQFITAIGMYRLDHNGELPASLKDLVVKPPDAKDWKGPYLENTKEAPKDPWGRDYIYTVLDKKRYRIVCSGKYGREVGDGLDKEITGEELIKSEETK